ncbi:MAG: hypothetical protein C4526_07620 [Nitrospiraceae bacterium]|nr:MAG: hypothetical protein C4526_07620 [Nitrospiraceae bacterium]
MKKKNFNPAGPAFLLLFASFLLFSTEASGSPEKITVGEVEEVMLLPWGVRLPARIDTGAAVSSLDARRLRVKQGVAEFRLPEKYGGLFLRLPVKEWRNIKTARATERRPVVTVKLCLGPIVLDTDVTLTDRSKVKYPVLIGRNVLKDNFVVDCAEYMCAVPNCPIPPSQK